MVALKKPNTKLIVGILISCACIFLALRGVDTRQMWDAFQTADYRWLLPSGTVIFICHFLRALRWRYLLDPRETSEYRKSVFITDDRVCGKYRYARPSG